MSAVVFQGRDSRNHKAGDQAIAMDSYKSYFRKHDVFLSRKQEDATRTDRKIYCDFLYHFFMVVIIFKVATSI